MRLTSLRILAAGAIGLLLYFAHVAFVPIALALLLALVLSGPVEALHGWRVPRAISAAVLLIVILGVFAALVNFVSVPAQQWFASAPHTLRTIERIGPYNHVLGCAPVFDLRVADIGDVPFQSRYRLELSHDDIEKRARQIVDAGVVPLSVGGDHSISHPILKAVGRKAPVGMIHIDAHCDTGGAFDQTKFHHGGPFRQAVEQFTHLLLCVLVAHSVRPPPSSHAARSAPA